MPDSSDSFASEATPMEQMGSLYERPSVGCWLDSNGSLFRVIKDAMTSSASVRVVRLGGSSDGQSFVVTEMCNPSGIISFNGPISYFKVSDDPRACLEDMRSTLRRAGLTGAIMELLDDLSAVEDARADSEMVARA